MEELGCLDLEFPVVAQLLGVCLTIWNYCLQYSYLGWRDCLRLILIAK